MKILSTDLKVRPKLVDSKAHFGYEKTNVPLVGVLSSW